MTRSRCWRMALVFALAAALSTRHGNVEAWQAIGAGAIAAATADTWSTEIGTVLGGTPRHLITTGREVPPGTSGGVTIAGTLSGLTGSVLAARVACMHGLGDARCMRLSLAASSDRSWIHCWAPRCRSVDGVRLAANRTERRIHSAVQQRLIGVACAGSTTTSSTW